MNGEWQLIETAKPKRGQRVLTCWTGSERQNQVILINEYNPQPRELGSFDWWHSKPLQVPTYWMPLPEAPSTKETT